MRNTDEMEARLHEAIEARKNLLQEQLQAKDGTDAELQRELIEEIANLSGVITTLEWVLQTSVEAEDEAWAEEGDDGDDMIEIAEFSEDDMPPAIDAETRPTR